MKVTGIKRGYSTVTVEIDERDIPRLEMGVDLLMERYPNSDPIIDLVFSLRELRKALESK